MRSACLGLAEWSRIGCSANLARILQTPLDTG